MIDNQPPTNHQQDGSSDGGEQGRQARNRAAANSLQDKVMERAGRFYEHYNGR